MIATVLGDKARFCGENCKQGFHCDRSCGAMYGLHIVNNVPCLHREEWSLVTCRCAYCGEVVKGNVPDYLKDKFKLYQE